MDINNNTNISNLIANSISKLNLNNTVKNIETNKKPKEETQTDVDFKQEDISLMSEKPKTNQIDVAEIRKYASLVGEELSIDDINYGLMYGRSVIADYSA